MGGRGDEVDTGEAYLIKAAQEQIFTLENEIETLRAFDPATQRTAQSRLERLLVSSRLQLQPHNYTEQLLHKEPCIVPRHVKRAEDYIAQHCNENVTIEELANYSGTSSRNLYRGFQQFRGVSPMQYLKTTRLDRVHRMLRMADPSESVTRKSCSVCCR